MSNTICGNNTICNDNLIVGSTPQERITVDLSTLSGWSSVTDGQHRLRVRAKAQGYRDSDLSNPVTFNIYNSYSITSNLTNVSASASNPDTIIDTATLTFTANTDYLLPDSITVTGASYTYDKTTGTVVLSNPTSNVSITIIGEPALPQLNTPTNLSVTDTTAECDEVENAESYEYFVDGVSIGEAELNSGETWIVNENYRQDIMSQTFNVNFKSNNQQYSSLEFRASFGTDIYYDNTQVAYWEPLSSEPTWNSDNYRTIILSQPATGDLLTVLQAIAVKQ